MSFYSDIGKTVKELLEDDYFSNKRFKLKTKNDSQFEITTEGDISSKGPNASLSISRKAFPLSLDKFKIKSDGRFLIDAALKTGQYSKFTISAEDGRQEPGKPLQSYAKIGCEFDFPSVGIVSDIDLVNGPIVKTSAVYRFDKSVYVGSEVLVNTHFEENLSPEIADLNVGIAYKQPTWLVSAKSTDFLKAFKVSYMQIISPSIIIGTQFDYRTKINFQKITLGSKILLGDKTMLKLKVDSNAMFSSSFQHKMTDFAKLTLSTEVDVKEFSTDTHKFGIGLHFE